MLTRKTTKNFAPLIVCTDIDHVNVYLLLVNGDWGSWGSWIPCTKTCVGGTRTRYRSCNNPTPINGCSPCLGLDYETVSCSTTILCSGISIICCLAPPTHVFVHGIQLPHEPQSPFTKSK
jgi:hypothetical protein